jgi:lambda family phage tail tape measure protein
MADNLGSLIVTLETNAAKFAADMGAAARATMTAMEQMQASAKKVENSLGALTGQILRYAAAYVAVDRLTASFTRSVNEMDALVKMSQKFGVATDTLQSLGYAGKLAGVDINELAVALKGLSVNVSQAAGGSKADVAAFKALGVAFADAEGHARPVGEVLLDIANKFATAEDGTNKAAWAVKLFGKSGLEMIPMLNQGRAGLSEMANEAHRFGIVLSQDVLLAAEAFNDNLTKIGAVMQGQMNAAIRAMLPNLNLLADSFLKVVTNSRSFYGDTTLSRNADVMTMGLAALADAAIKTAQGFGYIAQSVITAARGFTALQLMLGDLSNPVTIAQKLMKGESVFSEATRAASKQADMALADFVAVNKTFFADWGAVSKTLRDAMDKRDRELAARPKTPATPAAKPPAKLQLPAPPGGTVTTPIGESKEEAAARRALKAQIDGRIATLEASLAQERDVWTKNSAYVAQLRAMELIDEQTLDRQKTAQREITLSRTIQIYDAEVAELGKLRVAAKEDSERIDIDNRIAAARAKRAQAVVDAGQAESAQRLDAALAQAKLNVQLREYAIALERSVKQQSFDAEQTGKSAAAVARLTAEYRVMADVDEQIRQAQKTSPVGLDVIGAMIDAAAMAKKAGESASAASETATMLALTASTKEYLLTLGKTQEAQAFETALIGKNAAEVAGLIAQYRILADVEEMIRQAARATETPADKLPGVDAIRAAASQRAEQAKAFASTNQDIATATNFKIALDEYVKSAERAQEAQAFEASLIGKNTAEVARLTTEYRMLSDVKEQLRIAQKGSTKDLKDQADVAERLAVAEQAAAKAGLAAQLRQDNLAVISLSFSMQEYLFGVAQRIALDNTLLDLTGRTTQEIEKVINARRIQLDVEEQIRRAQMGSSVPINRAPFEAQAAEAIAMSSATTDRRFAQLRDPWLGAQVAVVAYGEEASKVGEQVGNVFTMAFRGMEDAFVNFVKTGKLSFRDLAESIISEIVRIQVRKAAAGIGDWLFNIGRNLFGAFAGGGGGGASIVDAGITAMSTFAAQGGIFLDGVKKFANGGVVNDPTLFALRGGAGLMGEAGPEAILPLARSSTGRLGVVAQTTAGGATAVNVSNVYHIDARSDRGQIIQLIEEGGRRTQASIQNQIARGSFAYTRPA